MNNTTASTRRQGVLALRIQDTDALYCAYMPFIEDGGLFIPTDKSYMLGDEVLMLIHFMQEAEKLPVPGKVVWITPQGAQGNRPAGVGVQFRDGGEVRTKIESYIVGAAENAGPTHTM